MFNKKHNVKKYIHKTEQVGHILSNNILEYSPAISKNENTSLSILVLGGSQGAEIFDKTINDCFQNGLRCILFITGKGLKKGEESTRKQNKLYGGKIREEFIFWAQEKKHSNKIRLIGLDLGTKRIGVSICDEKQSIATPYKTINRSIY